MSQLMRLRQQIRAVQTTKKITHAVRLVSMSLYAKLEKKNVNLEEYSKAIRSMFIQLLGQTDEWQSSLFSPNDVLDRSPLFILVATTKGLCGNLNSNLFRYFKQTVFIEEQQKPTFITIGKKATQFVQEGKYGEIFCSYQELSSLNYISVADDLVAKILEHEKGFSSVSLYCSILKSFFVQQPRKTTLIPLEMESIGGLASSTGSSEAEKIEDLIWEQAPEEALGYMSTNFLRSSVMHLLFEALLAEQAARFLAMDSSTNNAQKYLDSLVLNYNKQRQSLITREISELSATVSEL